jgi:hypothetical protein
MRARYFNRELAARNHGNRTKIHCRKDANRDGHVPAAGATMFLDVFVDVIVIDRVPVDRAVGVNMSENMTMLIAFAVLSGNLLSVAVRNAVVIVAGASGGSL